MEPRLLSMLVDLTTYTRGRHGMVAVVGASGDVSPLEFDKTCLVTDCLSMLEFLGHPCGQSRYYIFPTHFYYEHKNKGAPKVKGQAEPRC